MHLYENDKKKKEVSKLGSWQHVKKMYLIKILVMYDS